MTRRATALALCPRCWLANGFLDCWAQPAAGQATFLATQFLGMKQRGPWYSVEPNELNLSAWCHLHHNGHMDAELVRPCPTSRSHLIIVLVPSCLFKLLILSSYHGTGRHIIHIIRVGFVFRSSLGDTYMDQPRAQSTILNH